MGDICRYGPDIQKDLFRGETSATGGSVARLEDRKKGKKRKKKENLKVKPGTALRGNQGQQRGKNTKSEGAENCIDNFRSGKKNVLPTGEPPQRPPKKLQGEGGGFEISRKDAL